MSFCTSYGALDSILCPIYDVYIFAQISHKYTKSRTASSATLPLHGVHRMYRISAQISHKHTEPRTASSGTLPPHSVHCMHHIPLHSSTPTNQQMHASKVLAQNKQVYSMWPSVGKDNPGRQLEPLGLASTPQDARCAMKLPLHRPVLSSLREPATKEESKAPGPQRRHLGHVFAQMHIARYHHIIP
jgi:hypothetical protein